MGLFGAMTTRLVVGSNAAPENFPFMLLMEEGMPTQRNVSVAGEKVPTQSALYGAKTTRSSVAEVNAAPSNLDIPVMVEEISTQLKVLVPAEKVPTQLA